jgi:hypothetical protein
MLKPFQLHKNYTLNQKVYQLKLPFNLDCIIPENDSVRLLSQFVEKMDLRVITNINKLHNKIQSERTGSVPGTRSLPFEGLFQYAHFKVLTESFSKIP